MRFACGTITMLFALAIAPAARACESPASVCAEPGEGSFTLIEAGNPAPIFVDASADPAVQRAADNFAADLGRVGGTSARRIAEIPAQPGDLVIIGVLGQSPVIDGLVAAGKIDAGDLSGNGKPSARSSSNNRSPDVPRALVIVGVGSPRRGVRHL